MKPSRLTLLTSPKRLTKLITLDDAGRLTKKSAALARGTAQQVEVANAREFAHLLDNLDAHQCLAYGVTERLSARIGPSKYLRPGEISRTRDNFAWCEGPGWLYLDLDGKHDAQDVPRLRSLLAAAMPELNDAPQVWARSSSGGIRNTATGETFKGGLHAYIMVSDAQAIPALGKQLYDALWMNGHGHHELSRGENPAALERCLIDAAVFQPERLDYAAAPVLGEGLERIGGSVLATFNDDATPLNPARVKPLSDDQQAAVSAAKAESKAWALEGITRARKAILDALPPAKREATRRKWLAMDRQTLTPDTPIILRNGQQITAADILANPATYNGQHCYDPQDPHNDNANDSQGVIYADAKGCRVWSLAHGGRLFRIAEQAPDAPADVVALPPEPNRADVVSACYRHRASAVAGGLEAAADEVGATLDYAATCWHDHLAEQARPLHTATRPTQTFNTFEELAAHADATGESLFTLAKLGSGKSRELGGRVVRHAQAQGRPVLTVTVLRALTWQNATLFDATHYSDVEPLLAASHTVSTTVHSLANPRLDNFLQRLEDQKGLVVVDEAAAVSGLLFTTGGILGDHQRHEILRRLEHLAGAGVQFVMLDGDATPTACVLADLLEARVVSCSEQPYADPMAAVYPVQHLSDPLSEKTIKATPCHANIVEALSKGERVVLATDSREQADKLHRVYAPMAAGGALCVHGGNADEPEQAAFRSDPNAEAERWQLVTYSPALSVGVSVTSVEAHVFTFASAGTLDAAGLWQLARRYRRPTGGLVRFIVDAHLCRPQRQRLGLAAIQSDVTTHARNLDALAPNAELRGLVADLWQRNLYQANPLHALLGHLGNIGIDTTLAYSGDASGKDARKQAREAVRAARVERIASAERMDAVQAALFEKQAKATEADQARVERHRITEGLALSADDLEANGNLPTSLVEAALYDNLLTRVRRLSWLQAASQGADLEAATDRPSAFAYMKHTNAQAKVMGGLLDALRDETGRVVVTASKARDVADQYRGRIHVTYRDIPKPPHKKAKAERFTRWARDLLAAWGLECVEKTRPSADAERVYTYAEAEEISRYSERLACKHLAESGCTSKRLKPAWLSGLSGAT